MTRIGKVETEGRPDRSWSKLEFNHFELHDIFLLQIILETGDSSPADIAISGDPTIDQMLGLKVTTPTNIYNVQLQRVNHKLFHEDVRYLSVSTDKNGRTVFTEEYKPVGNIRVSRMSNC